MIRQFILLSCFLQLSFQSSSQSKYPKGYFQWPVAASPSIVANFGEMRSNHFHMGLDCKTNQRENQPILASADGYVAKVKIEPFGFGRCIYINHPNGTTTVYAHLNKFFPALQQYIIEQQHRMKKWNIFIDIPAGKFKLKKGDFIAYSGNTGGSQGPHLHFEIRDTKSDKVLNPLLFGFPIPDNVPPDILRLAVYDRLESTYEQSPKILTVTKVKGIYSAPDVIVKTKKVSFGISAIDTYTGSNNPNGIYKATLFDNGAQLLSFTLDSISYDETRYENAHIDYKTKSSGGAFIQHLSRLPGYEKGIYDESPTDGAINLDDENIHQIRIEVLDAAGNKSTLNFNLQRIGIKEKNEIAEGALFKPGLLNIFENEDISFYLPEGSIYDSFRFRFKKIINAGNTTYQLNDDKYPLQKYFTLKINRKKIFSDTGKVIMKNGKGEKAIYHKAYYDKGWYKADFRELGNFELIEDTLPPTITPIGFANGMNTSTLDKILFKVTDNTENLASFNGYIDGQWILFSNDKGKIFIYNFDKYCSAGTHQLSIIATDLAGNTTEKKYSFIR